MYAEIKENMSRDGIQMAHYLESLRLTEAQYKEKNVKEVALRRLQGELLLYKLMEMEKLQVSETEANSEIEKILARYGSEDVLKRLRELYIPGTKYYEELKMRIGYRKLIESFFE